MIDRCDLNAATFRVGAVDELNVIGLRRSRIVHHPPSWSAFDSVKGRLVGIPKWGSIDVTVEIATIETGLTGFSCHLSELAIDQRPEIDWGDVRQRLAAQAMVGTSLLVRHGLAVFARPDVFRATTTIEMMCPIRLTDAELATLDELVR